MRNLAIRRAIASVLVWAALTALAFGQSKLDAGIERTLSEIGTARVLVTMAVPKLGEAASAACRDPAGFVADLLGGRGRHVQRIVDLPVVVVETDRGASPIWSTALTSSTWPPTNRCRCCAKAERAPASCRRKTSTPHPLQRSSARGESSFERARAR